MMGEWRVEPLDQKGERHGLVQDWDEKGTLTYAFEYVHGKAHGKGRKYHENGELAFEGEFVNGVAHGLSAYVRSEKRSSMGFPDAPKGTWRVEHQMVNGECVLERYFDKAGRPMGEVAGPDAPEKKIPKHLAKARKLEGSTKRMNQDTQDWDAACEDLELLYREVLKLDSKNVAANCGLANHFSRRLDAPDVALPFFASAYELGHRERRFLLDYAAALEQEKQTALAAEIAREAEALKPIRAAPRRSPRRPR